MALQPIGQFLNQMILINLVERNERYALKLERRKLRDASDPFQLEEHAFQQHFRLSRRLVRNLDPVHPALPYYNRKGYYSINAQMICDADMNILNCYARFPGSTHDSAIWSLCTVRHLVEKFVQEELNECWLIGDSGYGLQPWRLTAIEHTDPNSPKGRYTRCHILARNNIERCFGILKQKLRCLLKHRTLHYDPVKAGKIIYTCAVLHNMSQYETILKEQIRTSIPINRGWLKEEWCNEI